MIDEKRRKEARENFSEYLREGLIRKQKDAEAEKMYIHNSDISLKLAEKMLDDSLKPYLWSIVVSYYSMFYMANAVLLHLGYRTGRKIVHKVTSDALIVLVLDKLRKELLEEYENIKDDALEIASMKSEELMKNYELELEKRSKFQYNMTLKVQEQMARTSVKRAAEFILEMKKLLV
ncbi:MAG TPA: hypothetical protein VJA18_00495 [Candidatus Nanoarchaeia archaeon]|nr:hypothetical protein [Candidatus Nanoarchaeia archaeon]